MESTLLSVSASAVSIFSLSKSLNLQLCRRVSTTHSSHLTILHLNPCRGSNRYGPVSFARGLGSRNMGRALLQLIARSASYFASGGGGFGGIDGNAGGGGGDDAAEGGDAKPSAVATGAADVSGLSSDVIILDVGGMTCGGCAASVKRILESQPQVSSASVNLATETAIVWPVSEAMVAPNWKKDIGEALAKHLTSCGFTSYLRDQVAIEGDIQL